jgi:hypothetical protein
MHRPNYYHRSCPHSPIPLLIRDPHDNERSSLVRVAVRAHGHKLWVERGECVREGGNVGERLVGCVLGHVEGGAVVTEVDGGC